MRYLFGDSAPFPLGYNFLSTLESFMTAATRIVQLEHESTSSTRQLEEQAAVRMKGLEALDQFHTVVMRAVQDTAQKVQHALALEYAHRVADFASGYVDEHRRVALATNEREVGQLLMESERRATEQRAALDTFLKTARLHVLSTQVSMRLAEGKDARPSMTAVFEHPEGIQSVFVIGTSKVPAWSMPRKVSELTQGLDLLVGIEKSWLRGTVSPKQVNVDDWVIAQFDLADDVSFDVTLRKKLLEKETLAFQLRKTEGVLTGKVVGPDGVPSDLGPDDLGNLDRLWQAVRLGVRDVLDQKEQLLAVSLDGKPIFEQKLVVPLVVRLISMFAPTVREIARRSPNEFELSLKVETDQGRREEVYLRKEQLTSQLQPLSAAGREVFAPLGLDTWVPGTTAAPPEVVPSVVPSPPGSNRTLG